MITDDGNDNDTAARDMGLEGPKTYKEALAAKQSKANKSEASRLKHNRNAKPGYELDDRSNEEEQQTRIKKAIANRRTTNIEKEHRSKSQIARILSMRAKGYSYSEIASQRNAPSVDTINRILADDPSLKEQADSAYDGYVRGLVEQQIRMVQDADETPGLSAKPLEIMEQAMTIEDAQLRHDHIKRASVMIRHGQAVASMRLARVGKALQVGAQKLPEEWGYHRDSGQEVIVIETPTGWMANAATGRPEDPDGQGKAAAAAREQWRQMRDVTPK